MVVKDVKARLGGIRRSHFSTNPTLSRRLRCRLKLRTIPMNAWKFSSPWSEIWSDLTALAIEYETSHNIGKGV